MESVCVSSVQEATINTGEFYEMATGRKPRWRIQHFAVEQQPLIVTLSFELYREKEIGK